MVRKVNIKHVYDRLRPEHFPDLSPEDAEEWISSQQRAARMVGQVGEIRMDLENGRLVRLLEAAYDVSLNGTKTYKSDWWVEDVLTKKRYRLNMIRWSVKTFTEMEVLAWAAQ